VAFVNKEFETVMGVPGARRKPYYLARTVRFILLNKVSQICNKDVRSQAAEVNINDYNPALLLAWQGNVDVQYVWSGSSAVVAYTTGYATKGESGKTGHAIQEALKSASDSKEVHYFVGSTRVTHNIEVIVFYRASRRCSI